MLAPDVQEVVAGAEIDRTTIHAINLSRGLLATCDVPEGTTPFLCRIPSTWCEQKRWNDILVTLPTDFWFSMAMAVPLVVHDVSEKPRQTRAVWQGLSWVRYAVNAAWDLPVDLEVSRSGVNVNPYWAKAFHDLPRTTRTLLRYYLNFYRGDGFSVDVAGCDTCGKGPGNV